MATSNTGYALNTNKWFLGQVPPCQNQHSKPRIWEDVHGDRVKVRIPGMHPMSFPGEEVAVTDENLPWAIVAKPTTHGNRNAQSTGLWGGEWVIGFFMDEDCQIPVITQVLGNNENYYEILRCENGTTLGKRVGRYNGGRNPTIGEVKGGSNPNSPAQPTKEEIKEAVKDPEPDPNDPNADVPIALKVSGESRYVVIGEDGKTEYQRSLERVGETPERAAEIAAEQRREVLGQ